MKPSLLRNFLAVLALALAPAFAHAQFVADVAITKSDGAAIAVPGSTVTYTIVATNGGPDFAIAALVSDTLPAALSGASWTCVAAGGGLCTPTGTGNIGDAPFLPPGGSAVYTLTATVSAGATGTLVNTATIISAAADPNPANNTATDSDALVAPPAATPIPGLSGYSVAMLAALLALAAVRTRRR